MHVMFRIARDSQTPHLPSCVNDANRLCRWGGTPDALPNSPPTLHVTTLTLRFFLDSGHNLKPLFIRFNSLRSRVSVRRKNV